MAIAPCCASADAPPSRLSGIVIGPDDRVAIFADTQRGLPTPLREGDRLGPWQIRAINPDSVLVVGPDGPRLLGLQAADPGTGPQPAAAPEVPVLTAAQDTGMSIGRLATRHDACVRRGLSPPSARGSEDQLRAMLDAMDNLPARTGDGSALDAPTKAMAGAMRSGWDAAVRADAGIRLDAGLCRQIGELWTKAAPRFGFQ